MHYGLSSKYTDFQPFCIEKSSQIFFFIILFLKASVSKRVDMYENVKFGLLLLLLAFCYF